MKKRSLIIFNQWRSIINLDLPPPNIISPHPQLWPIVIKALAPFHSLFNIFEPLFHLTCPLWTTLLFPLGGERRGAAARKDIICYSVRSNKNVSRPWLKSGVCMHSQTQGWSMHAVTVSPLVLAQTVFLSPSVSTHTHTHTLTLKRWPCGLCWALWMKKRSHLSDSSSRHLAAPFKNTLYSLLTLKLHLYWQHDGEPHSASLSFSTLSFSLSSLELPLSFHPHCQQPSQKSEGQASVTM